MGMNGTLLPRKDILRLNEIVEGSGVGASICYKQAVEAYEAGMTLDQIGQLAHSLPNTDAFEGAVEMYRQTYGYRFSTSAYVDFVKAMSQRNIGNYRRPTRIKRFWNNIKFIWNRFNSRK